MNFIQKPTESYTETHMVNEPLMPSALGVLILIRAESLATASLARSTPAVAMGITILASVAIKRIACSAKRDRGFGHSAIAFCLLLKLSASLACSCTNRRSQSIDWSC